jgi:hypothetical protein
MFDPRREHSSIPTATCQAAARRPAKAGRALRRNPKGLALIGPSTPASSIGSGMAVAASPAAPPLTRQREIQTAGIQ